LGTYEIAINKCEPKLSYVFEGVVTFFVCFEVSISLATKMWNVQATKNGTTAFIWMNNYWASTRVSNTWKLGRELWVKSRTPQPDKCFVEIQSSFLFVLPSKRTSIQKCTMNTRAAVPHLLLLGWMICPVLKGIEKYSQHCPY